MAATALERVADASLIQLATSTGSPPASNAARYRPILGSQSSIVSRSRLLWTVGLVLGERRTVVGVSQGAKRPGEPGPVEFLAEETVDRLDEDVLTEVKHGRVSDLVLADVVP